MVLLLWWSQYTQNVVENQCCLSFVTQLRMFHVATSVCDGVIIPIFLAVSQMQVLLNWPLYRMEKPRPPILLLILTSYCHHYLLLSGLIDFLPRPYYILRILPKFQMFLAHDFLRITGLLKLVPGFLTFLLCYGLISVHTCM